MFKKVRSQVEEKYGVRTCDLELKRVSSSGDASQRQSNSSGSTSGNYNSLNSNDVAPRRMNNSSNDTLSVVENPVVTRTSVNSQYSVDSATSGTSILNVMPKARVLSSVMVGITRRKSNVKRVEGGDDLPRIALNKSLNSQTSLHAPKQGSGQDFNWSEETKTSSVVVVSNKSNNGNVSSRPSSGHFGLTTSTPNHSRSPSMTSNRDSVISYDGYSDHPVPPPVPPKHCKPDASFENLSIASLEEIDGAPQRVFKRRPPPPPPSTTLEMKTPPTPPKKPPFKPPVD